MNDRAARVTPLPTITPSGFRVSDAAALAVETVNLASSIVF